MLNFENLTLEKKELIESYTIKYGQMSCQYSFVANFCHKAKYDDHFCIINDFLVFFRKGISSDNKRIFLFPIGDFSRKEELKDCIQKLKADCIEQNCELSFDYITKKDAELLTELFPNEYKIQENRDYFEYIYEENRYTSLKEFRLRKKRQIVNKFYKSYESRLEISLIQKKDIDEIKVFEKKWFEENKDKNPEKSLKFEDLAIDIAFKYYDELNLSGIIVKIDKKIVGYFVGSELSNNCYDSMFAKADKEYKELFTVLFTQSFKYYKKTFKYINMEEDIGLEGLRKMKLSYYPDILLEKYSVQTIN